MGAHGVQLQQTKRTRHVDAIIYNTAINLDTVARVPESEQYTRITRPETGDSDSERGEGEGRG